MSLSNPKIDYSILPAFVTAQNEAQKILVIGQMKTGTATPGVVVESIGNANEQDALFGANSMVATMARAIKRVNKISRVDVLPLEDAVASTAATGSFTPIGTANENGTIYVTVGSKFHNTYEVVVAKDDTPTDIVDKIVAFITADNTSLVTAVNNTGVLELTAVNEGREGNFISTEIIGEVDGITYTIVGMNGGAGVPVGVDDGAILTAIDPDTRYQAIIWPQTYDATITPAAIDYVVIREFLTDRFPAPNRILDGMAFVGRTDTFANLKTLGTLVDDKVLTVFGNKPVNDTDFYVGSALLEMDYVQACYFVAIRALRLTTGAQIANYVISTQGSLDSIGGIALASLPYFNTPFDDLIPVADKKYFWTDDEVKELTDNGIALLGNNIANNKVISGTIATTYLTNAASDPDPTYKFLNYFDTFTNIREFFFNNLKARYEQSRLVERDLTPLRNEANQALIRSTLLGIYQDLSNLVLVEKGREAQRFFNDNLVITIDKATGTVTVAMQIQPVVQLRAFDIVMQVNFN